MKITKKLIELMKYKNDFNTDYMKYFAEWLEQNNKLGKELIIGSVKHKNLLWDFVYDFIQDMEDEEILEYLQKNYEMGLYEIVEFVRDNKIDVLADMFYVLFQDELEKMFSNYNLRGLYAIPGGKYEE